jgi:hypothetical protein
MHQVVRSAAKKNPFKLDAHHAELLGAHVNLPLHDILHYFSAYAW